ncbi:MAG: outer membrane lipoprotein carrier protein LolA [Bdellovibrionales bacterium]|nr:outer membrane lipoprotein carrier protein LolA [Bdellovibrionales bacterium]
MRSLLLSSCLFLGLLFVSSVTFAEGEPCEVLPVPSEEIPAGVKSEATSPEAAKKMRDSLQSAYRKIKSLKAEFSQSSYLKSLDLSEESNGKLVLGIPGKLFWEYEKPEPQTFLLKDDEFRLFQPLEKQLIIQSTRKYFLSDIPVSFLLGLGDLAEDFEVLSGCKAGKVVTLTLKPKPRESAKGGRDPGLKELKLSFSTVSYFPEVAEILDREENRTSLKLSKLRENEALQQSTFTLTVPPGTDIQDLRG